MKAERQHCEYHPPEWLRACEISATYEVGGRWYCGFHKVKGPGVAAAAERRSRDDAACRIVRALAALDEPLYWEIYGEPETWQCAVCQANSTRGDIQHTADCPWQRAVAWAARESGGVEQEHPQ